MTTKYLSSLALIALLAGCGGGSKNSSNDTSYSGVIVDPYIQGAILCEDVNKNNSCDEGEQTSSASNLNGQFTFDKELTAGSNIIVKTHGKHNGFEYTLNLSATVDSNKEVKVISPLTTLESKGLTKAQIKTLLTTAGLSGIEEDDISADPMSGLLGKKSLSDSELTKLQASLATYGLLKVMEGSSALKDLRGTDFADNSQVAQIASAMVTNIKSALSQTTFDDAKKTIDDFKTANPTISSYVPDMTSDVVIKTAVVVMDRLVEVGYKACNESDGDVTTALNAVSSASAAVLPQVGAIGQYYYGVENRISFGKAPSIVNNALPVNISNGKDNSSGVVAIAADNTVTQRSDIEIPFNDISFYVTLNNGTLGDGTIEIKRNYAPIQSIQITDSNSNTQSFSFTNDIASISSSLIASAENKISLVLGAYETKYFYVHKGSYDISSNSAFQTGNSSYSFTSVKANGSVANDMFVNVENSNDPDSNVDNKWLIFLPSDSNTISVTNLKATGGYNVSSQYEQYVVASGNNNNAGQDIAMTFEIDLREVDSSKKISGTYKKVDNSGNEVPFSQTDDGTDGNIWLHAHYTHPTATYSYTCVSGSAVCISPNESGNVWIGAQDMHLDHNNAGKASYNFTSGEYEIEGLATDTGYTILAFWQTKGVQGDSYSVTSTTGNDIVLQSQAKTVNGTLTTGDTKVRLVRVVTFSGEANNLNSQIKDIDSSNNFEFTNYQFDTAGSTTYILWGATDSELDLTTQKKDACNDTNKCRQIIVGGDNDSSTNISIQ